MTKRDEIVSGLRYRQLGPGTVACLGCDWENSCSIHGCRVLQEAADMLENDETYSGVLQDAVEKWKKAYGTLREKHSALLKQNEELRDAAAQVTKLAAEAAVERDWISVDDRLPEVWRNDATAELVNYMIYSPDFGVDIGSYHAKAKKWLCMALPCTVTYWMPLPEPPKTNDRMA